MFYEIWNMSKERRLLSPFLHADILLFVEQIFKTVAEYDDILQKMTLAYAPQIKRDFTLL